MNALPEPISPTRALCKIAAMAASGLPAPKDMQIYADRKAIHLGFATIADQARWLEPLGTDPEYASDHITAPGADGECRRIVGGRVWDWHGWHVGVQTSDPAARAADTIDAEDPDVALVLAHAEGAEVTA